MTVQRAAGVMILVVCGSGCEAERADPADAGAQVADAARVDAVPADAVAAADQAPVVPGVVVTRLTTGTVHSCKIDKDQSLRCWGDNYYGQLGDGSRKQRAVPTRVGTSADWLAVSAGRAHTCGLRAGGTLWCWGDNSSGQQGDGKPTDKPPYWYDKPTRVGSSSGWRGVGAGGSHTCAIKTDGTLWCWGTNHYGQLGDGTIKVRLKPIKVGSAKSWSTVRAGGSHTCATRTDGTLWCWGYNDKYQIGVSSPVVAFVPVQVGAAKDWTLVSAGSGGHTCGIRGGGTLWCWGVNYLGAAGQPTTTQEVKQPTRVGTSAGWSGVVTGRYHSCATRTDGTLWCWGANPQGQLGTGVTGLKATPAKVMP